MRTHIVVASLSLAAFSEALVIDDFTIPYSRTISSGTWVDFQADLTLLTGERDVQTEVLFNNGGGQAHLNIGNGLFSLSNDAGVGSWVQLQYDIVGDEIGNAGEGKVLTNAASPFQPFPEGTDRVRFHLATVNATIALQIHLYRDGEFVYQNFINPPVTNNQVIDLRLDTVQFQDSDALIVHAFLGTAGSDVTLTKIELVPEPASFLALGGGAALLLWKRRRRP